MVLKKRWAYLLKDWNQVLIAGAFSGEIDLLFTSGNFPHIQTLGIGNLDAGLSTYKYLTENPEIETVLFFGSAGAYTWSKIPIRSFVNASIFSQSEIAPLFSLAKQLPTEFIQFDPVNPLYPIEAICNSPSSITLHDLTDKTNDLWQVLQIENLECYGIARVCQKLNRQFQAHFAITNLVSPDGSSEWQKNWRELSTELQLQFLNQIS
ncbi:MAG: phosphorylase [Leptospira sp.]|nr:phosphorylase [Leptospira sp.]